MHYRCAQVDRGAADEFFGLLHDGTDLSRGNPIHTLREMFPLKPKDARTPDDQAFFIAKAWNMWRHQRDLRQLKRFNGEKFPEIK